MILTDSVVNLFPDDIDHPEPPSGSADPYADLDDLMCVVEALCPVWPARPIDTHEGGYLL